MNCIAAGFIKVTIEYLSWLLFPKILIYIHCCFCSQHKLWIFAVCTIHVQTFALYPKAVQILQLIEPKFDATSMLQVKLYILNPTSIQLFYNFDPAGLVRRWLNLCERSEPGQIISSRYAIFCLAKHAAFRARCQVCTVQPGYSHTRH